jgi:hypothetical protein
MRGDAMEILGLTDSEASILFSEADDLPAIKKILAKAYEARGLVSEWS